MTVDGLDAATRRWLDYEQTVNERLVNDATHVPIDARSNTVRASYRPERRPVWPQEVVWLPRRQTRVLTWPLVTVFGFIAQPKTHFFLKPMVTRRAADEYGFDFEYRSRPNWQTYKGLLTFARTVSRDLRDLRPRDMIDIQSFLWVQGSDEYPD